MLRLNSSDNSNSNNLKLNRNSFKASSSSSSSSSSPCQSASSASTTLVHNNNNTEPQTTKTENTEMAKNCNEYTNPHLNEHEDDQEDSEDEYDDSTFLSPMVVVKYAVEYDYDEKKFQLIEGEKLFLISKANEDWWLCLRLEENLTFFVPASYVKELIVNRSLKPPPRPPPPPPSITKKYSAATTSSDETENSSSISSKPPEIKKRTFLNNPVDLDQIYENLSNLSNTKEIVVVGQEGEEEDENTSLIDSMLEDLDECLEKEERSSFENRIHNTGLITTSGVATIKPVYDEERIYQNLPLTKPQQNINSTTSNEQVVNIDVESEENDDNDDEDDYRDQTQNDSVNVIEEEEEDEEEEIESNEILIPKGWKTGLSKCKRKFFFNEYNKDRWYLNHDTNGKHYFYNADNQSLWELPTLLYNREEDNKKSDAAAEDKGQFRQKLDEDLPTFRNFFNRLSMRQKSKEGLDEFKRPESIGPELICSSIYPKLPNSELDINKVVISSPSSLASNRTSTATIVSYSHKPPSDLNSVFKCIVLEKVGKKCKKTKH